MLDSESVAEAQQSPETPTPLLVRALRHEPVERTPVWFMRQAGRSLPEYRELRAGKTLMETCLRPEEAAEVTLQPVRRHGVDAAILFSDIVTPLHAIGVGGEIKAGVGPVIDDPIRTEGDLARLRDFEPAADMPELAETVRLVCAELGPDTPLIGFSGAPFTLASYLVEGGPSKQQSLTKAMMLGEPALWGALIDRLADLALAFIRAQVEAGATAVQLFDSWAGALTPEQYAAHVLPASQKVFAGLADLGVPRVHFGVGTGELLGLFAEAGADVVGVDWRVPIDAGWERIGLDKGVQGNLDPAACLAPWPAVEHEVLGVLDRIGGRSGHIFNLGHGVLPETDPTVLTRIVELVHERTAS